MLFNVILLNLMKLMNNNRSVEGLELLCSGTFNISVTEFLECGVRRRGIVTAFPELIAFVEL